MRTILANYILFTAVLFLASCGADEPESPTSPTEPALPIAPTSPPEAASPTDPPTSPSVNTVYQGEDYDRALSPDVSLVDSDMAVGGFEPGDTLVYDNINFDQAIAIDFHFGSINAGLQAELRIGSPTGTLIGTLTTVDTGDWFLYQDLRVDLVENVTGTHSLYLLALDNERLGLGVIDYFTVVRNGEVSSGGNNPGGETPSCETSKERGKALFESTGSPTCAGCHGDNAQSDTFKLIDLDASVYRHGTMASDEPSLPLYEYIPRFMPPGGGQCNEQCGEDIATYLKSLGNTPWCPGDAPVAVAERRDVLPKPLHRMGNQRYRNAVRDLLGVYIDVSVLPKASALGGFDNAAEALTITGSMVDSYFTLSAEAVEQAAANPLVLGQKGVRQTASDAPVPFVFPYTTYQGEDYDVTQSPDVRLVDNDNAVGGFEPGDHIVYTDVEMGQATSIEFNFGSINAGLQAEIRIDAPDGPVIGQLTTENTGDWFVYRKVNVNLTQTVSGNHTLYMVALGNDQIGLGVIDYFTVVRGNSTTGSACDIQTEACGEQVIKNVARRAFGKPLSGEEETELVTIYRNALASEGNVGALKIALQGVLMSPQFLFEYVSAESANNGERLHGYTIAKRLAALIWSSVPDDILIDAAVAGELDKTDGIHQQVERMVASPKAQGLVDEFAEQWLKLRLYDGHQPDANIFASFTPAVRQAMREESTLFFEDYLSNGLSVKSMVNPDFTFLNDRLADHYEIPRPNSSVMTRVERSGDQRRGLLELGAWLTAESNADDSSIIKRGQWVLDHITCTPAPPPPAGVDTDLPSGQFDTKEQRLAAHRANAVCAVCHDSIDPAGLPFEHFNGVGAPQISTVVATGGLPDGTEFNDSRELAEKLETSETFANCFTKKFYSYAVGRVVDETQEGDLIKDVYAASGKGDVSLVDFIKVMATSKPFTHAPTTAQEQ